MKHMQTEIYLLLIQDGDVLFQFTHGLDWSPYCEFDRPGAERDRVYCTAEGVGRVWWWSGNAGERAEGSSERRKGSGRQKTIIITSPILLSFLIFLPLLCIINNWIETSTQSAKLFNSKISFIVRAKKICRIYIVIPRTHRALRNQMWYTWHMPPCDENGMAKGTRKNI